MSLGGRGRGRAGKLLTDLDDDLLEFLRKRLNEDRDRYITIHAESGRLPSPVGKPIREMSISLIRDLDLKIELVCRCARAWEQHHGASKTLWGEHNWPGLRDACRLLADHYQWHPDWSNGW